MQDIKEHSSQYKTFLMILTIPERIPERTHMRYYCTQLATCVENDAVLPTRPTAILAKRALTHQRVLI